MWIKTSTTLSFKRASPVSAFFATKYETWKFGVSQIETPA
jgi:hypothetical protein